MCLTSLGFCNPSLLKSRVKMYIIFHFMSLSSKKIKKQQKKLKQTRSKRGLLQRNKMCVKTKSNKHANTFGSSFLCLTPVVSLSLSQTQISLFVSPSSVISVSSSLVIYLCLSSLLSPPMMVLRRPISHHSENPNQNPVKPN